MKIRCPICHSMIAANSMQALNNVLYDHIHEMHPEKEKEYLEI